MEDGAFHCPICGKNSQIENGRLVPMRLSIAPDLPVGGRYSRGSKQLCQGCQTYLRGMRSHLAKNTRCPAALAHQQEQIVKQALKE